MSWNRRSGGYGGGGGGYGGGGGGGNYGHQHQHQHHHHHQQHHHQHHSYGHGGNNYGGGGNYGGGHYGGGGGGGNYGGGGGRYNNYNNYGRNPKMSPWEAGVTPGGGMMPNVHPNQMALASDLLSKLLAPNQSGYGGGQNWAPNHGMMRRPEPYKNQNRRRPDNRNRRPPPKRDDKKKDSKTEADRNNQSGAFIGGRRDTDQDHINYSGIPTAVLFCHVCSKHMWDSASFEKHVRGRPHELMMTYLDEAYKMQVELMRHEIKASENQREIDLERMHAQNKGKAKPLFRNYCPMCNINFYGPLTGHRKSDRHRKLKQFLHPECKICDMLFHTRLEWDDHKLSSDHLRKLGIQRRRFNPSLKDNEFELLDVVIIEDTPEEIPVVLKSDMLSDIEIKEEKDEGNEVGKSDENKNKPETTDIKVEDDPKVSVSDIEIKGGDDTEVKGDVSEVKEGETEVKEGETEGNVEKVKNDVIKENENTKGRGPPGTRNEKYIPVNVVGRELVVRTGGFVCRICSTFMKDNEEAVLHCQTASHYVNFTSITKLHAKINNRKRRMREEKRESEKRNLSIKETSSGRPEKRARMDTTVEKPVADANTTAKTESVVNVAEDDDVQEIKVDVPIIEVQDDDNKNESANVAKPEIFKDFSVPAPPPPAPASVPASVIKTNSPSPRGRGGRGRGMSRRGRSSR